jgi:hypothetical protein
MSTPIAKSAIAIARLLGTEGFTQKAANAVKRYARRKRPAWIAARHERVRKAFGQMVRGKLDDADRHLLGRFLSQFARTYLDAGIRIGLGCRIAPEENDEQLAE